MKKLLFVFLLLSGFATLVHAQAPVLGTYPASTVIAGKNGAVSPASSPSNTTALTAYTSTSFAGVFNVDPASGLVSITDARPAGTYTVTVKGFGPGGTSSTSFVLTVTNPDCSSGTFASQVSFGTGTNPNSVAIADFNNDGNQDWITANYNSNNVTVRLGNGTGSFGAANNITLQNSPMYVSVGDFNEDGKQDFAAANNNSGSVSIRYGDGAGNFSGSTNISVPHAPYSVITADFNNDGHLDLACGLAQIATVSIRLGDGAGNFTAAADVAVGSQPFSLAIGDFNNDGNQDFATANLGANYSSIRLGDGTGNFTNGTDVNLGGGAIHITIGDFNNDGKQDLAAALYSYSQAAVRLGNGTGGFSGSTTINTDAAPYNIQVGDFNGDGKQDLVTANSNSSNLTIAPGNGSGGFPTTSTITVSNSPFSAAVGDFNADNHQDIAVANCGANTVGILANLTSEIQVKGNSIVISDGDSSPSTADNTDFGSIYSCSGSITKTFIIENTGTASLTIGSPSITGANAAAYSIISMPSSIVNAGASTSIQISFNPYANAVQTAVISFTTNDCNENPFDFTVQGTGISFPASVPVLTSDDDTVCIGSSTNINIPSANDGFMYQLRDELGNPVGSSFIGDGNTHAISTGALSFGLNYYIEITNGSCTYTGTQIVHVEISQSTAPGQVSGSETVCPPVNSTLLTLSGYIGTILQWQYSTDGGSNWNTIANTSNLYTATNVTQNTMYRAEVKNEVCPSGFSGSAQISMYSSWPFINCRTDQSRTLGIGQCNYTCTGNEFDPSMYDNFCPGTTITNNINGGSTLNGVSFPPGITTVVWYVTDPSGHQAACAFNVEIIPSASGGTLSGSAVVCSGTNSNTLTLSGYSGTISKWQYSTDGGSNWNDIANTSTSYTAVNVPQNTWYRVEIQNGTCGTLYSTVATIMFDTQLPVINCVGYSQVRNMNNGNCSYTVSGTEFDPTFSDNCPGAYINNSFNGQPTLAGASFPAGTTTVVWYVWDTNGHSAACAFTVTVNDASPPVASCNNLTLMLNPSGNATVIPAMLNNGSSDNCSIASMSISQTSFNCSNLGPNNVTLTVTDGSGNSSTCTGVVTVQDTVRPVANCQNVTVYLNASGMATVSPAMVNNGSTDNCGISAFSLSQTSFSCNQTGYNPVVLTVTDASGNSNTCASTVTVLENLPPVTLCHNATVYLDASGNASISPAAVDNGSYDECRIAMSQVIPNTFTCSNIGANTVILKNWDSFGYNTSCSAIVTVLDTIRPLAVCQNITVTLNASGTATITGAMINNGSSDNCGIASMTVSPSSFNCSSIGNNSVVFTVTDNSGNSSSCTATVTVNGSFSASISTVSNVSCFGGNNGQANAVPSGGTGPYSYSWQPSGGNAATASGLTAGNYTCTVTDANGCTSAPTVTITAPAVLGLTAASQSNPSCFGGSNGTAAVNPATGGAGSYTYNWTPGNPSGDGTTSVSGLTAGTWTCTVTDANACVNSVSFTLTQPSALIASSSATAILCNGGNATVTVSANGGTAPYTGTGTFTVTAGTYSYTVTDANGCAATSTITITQPAVLTASSSATAILCNGGNATVTVSANGGTAPYTGTGTFTVTAGTYSYTVTDANGCAATSTITITQPAVLTASSSATAILCNGGNATVTVSANGGTAPYTGTGTFTVTAGTYSYTVTDANGCTATSTITITQPAVLTASSSATAILCNGGNATVTVSANGGTAPYTGTGTFTVTAGTYSYTVTDANGCAATSTITVTEPAVLTASSSATVILCNGGNATVTVSANGGTAPYTGTGTFTVTAGTYSYTVTDANGCAATSTITVTQPAVLTVSSSATAILCNGGNATVTVSANGGTAPYTGTGTFTVTAGTYSYTVTDANGCAATSTITITEPAVLTASSSATAILCNGGNATVTVSANGGTAPYTGTGTFTVTAGTYSYTVTDANGCAATSTITITEPVAINSTAITTDVHCFGGSDGAIDITVNGGSGTYTYDWNSGAFISEDLVNINAGTYSVLVTDANNCSYSTVITINEPALLQALVDSVQDPSSCSGTNGSVWISVNGGTAGYTFLWNNAAATEDLTGIGAGNYTCTVTDTNGCSTTVSASINDPNPPLVSLALPMDTVCQTTQLPFLLTGESPSGGSFTGPGVTAGTFDPMAVNIGYSIVNYTYTDQNGCTAAAVDSIYVDICSGIAIAADENAVLVYPNPNNGTFTIQSNLPGQSQVLVYNSLGQIVISQQLQLNENSRLMLNEPGVYMVTVIAADGHRINRPVIVNR